MTLVTAWVRHNNQTKELYVASDSRLSGGREWDIGTKVLDLGRGDAVIAFAGNTDNAYPLMLQLQTAVQMHPKMRSRAYDLTILRGHLLNIFNDMWRSIANLPMGQSRPDPAAVQFILAGYSWKVQDFRIWTVYFDEANNEFKFRSASMHRKKGGGNKYFAFMGDDAGQANERAYDLLRERGRVEEEGMQMEPFEVLKEFILDPERPYIGGSPQISKVYSHMNVLTYNVYWPNKASNQVAYGGRVLMPFERNELLAFDPDSFEVGKTSWPDPRG
ncbi:MULTISPECIES: hypothetical protein [Vibrio]|uniref:hypothetical protein n=1 Tax=Vibrio TaxID=662 RepID=UPI000813286D|nr:MULTISPECIES: hypothetical protein [Vibrio]EKA4470936.1 hypothetical protein [Vibrio parahaemolyticus]ELP9499231.1 hypothetical protein [Vibrio alginolyticus]MBO0150154.1 hypothetical protein [Vibrio sp. Vb2424]MCF7480002.1 hypothetical protein [Vibrio sp. J2-4]MCR9505480.1 hypothetical protein [Vibrio alginolyticus]